MTDTVQITETTATGPDQPVGTLEHLDPHSLMLELNVRDAADLDAQFVASIKEHGVLIPIAAVRSDDGTVWGARRAAPGIGGTRSQPEQRPRLRATRNRHR